MIFIPKKRKHLSWLFFIALTLIIGGCDDDVAPNDTTPPTGNNVISMITTRAGQGIAFTGTFNDNISLASVSIVYDTWGLNEIIPAPGNPITFDVSYAFTVPANAESGDHIVVITATDVAGNATDFNVTVTLAQEEPDFEQLYVVGGFMWWWGWDFPELSYVMAADPDASGWFETVIPIWGGDYNTLKFLSEPSWEGHNWGLIDQNNPSAGMIDDPASAAIILNDMGLNPAYYRVRFNPTELKYEAHHLVPDIPVQSEMFIMGNGYPGYPDLDWNPSEAILMEAGYQGYGEHLFGISGLEFSDDVSIKFLGQNTGWGPLDVGFVDGGPMDQPISWVPTVDGDGTADIKFAGQAGTYTIVYDRFANRALIWKE